MAVLLIVTSGCSSLPINEYYSSKGHKNSGSTTEVDSSVIGVKTYQGIKTAVSTFVKEGREEGVLRVSDYDGDVPEAFNSVCREITNNTAIGAYAVDHMTQSYTKTASYYQVTLKIFYKHTKEQIQGIIYLNNASAVQSTITAALLGHKDYLVISIASETINEQYIRDFVAQYYRSEPKSLIALPLVNIAVYERPSNPRLLEIQITYPYTAEQEEVMKTALVNKATKALANAKSSSAAYSAMKACAALISTAGYSLPYGSTTAYGTVMDGIGNSEGYAMAFKLFCSMVGVKCTVVEGTLRGTQHYWNIIEVENYFYHVDPSACELTGISTAFLKNDVKMQAALYYWDMSKYDACKGTLTYNDII